MIDRFIPIVISLRRKTQNLRRTVFGGCGYAK